MATGVEDEPVSQAIVEYLGKGRSPFPRADDDAVVAFAADADPQALLARVKTLVDEMNAIEVDWSAKGLSEGAHLIRALIEHMEGHGSDWEALAMILEFPDGRFNSAHGYAYSPGDVISAVASHPRAVAPAVEAYTASYYQPEAPLPRKLLVQLDRASGRYTITFEDKDESRWKVTPHTYRALREELRPKFG